MGCGSSTAGQTPGAAQHRRDVQYEFFDHQRLAIDLSLSPSLTDNDVLDVSRLVSAFEPNEDERQNSPPRPQRNEDGQNQIPPEASTVSVMHVGNPTALVTALAPVPTAPLTGVGLMCLCEAAFRSLQSFDFNEVSLPKVASSFVSDALQMLPMLRVLTLRGPTIPGEVLHHMAIRNPKRSVVDLTLIGPTVGCSAFALVPVATPCITTLVLHDPSTATNWDTSLRLMHARHAPKFERLTTISVSGAQPWRPSHTRLLALLSPHFFLSEEASASVAELSQPTMLSTMRSTMTASATNEERRASAASLGTPVGVNKNHASQIPHPPHFSEHPQNRSRSGSQQSQSLSNSARGVDTLLAVAPRRDSAGHSIKESREGRVVVDRVSDVPCDVPAVAPAATHHKSRAGVPPRSGVIPRNLTPLVQQSGPLAKESCGARTSPARRYPEDDDEDEDEEEVHRDVRDCQQSTFHELIARDHHRGAPDDLMPGQRVLSTAPRVRDSQPIAHPHHHEGAADDILPTIAGRGAPSSAQATTATTGWPPREFQQAAPACCVVELVRPGNDLKGTDADGCAEENAEESPSASVFWSVGETQHPVLTPQDEVAIDESPHDGVRDNELGSLFPLAPVAAADTTNTTAICPRASKRLEAQQQTDLQRGRSATKPLPQFPALPLFPNPHESNPHVSSNPPCVKPSRRTNDYSVDSMLSSLGCSASVSPHPKKEGIDRQNVCQHTSHHVSEKELGFGPPKRQRLSKQEDSSMPPCTVFPVLPAPPPRAALAVSTTAENVTHRDEPSAMACVNTAVNAKQPLGAVVLSRDERGYVRGGGVPPPAPQEAFCSLEHEHRGHLHTPSPPVRARPAPKSCPRPRSSSPPPPPLLHLSTGPHSSSWLPMSPGSDPPHEQHASVVAQAQTQSTMKSARTKKAHRAPTEEST